MPRSWNENRLTAKAGSTIPLFKVVHSGIFITKIDGSGPNFGGFGSFAAHSLTQRR